MVQGRCWKLALDSRGPRPGRLCARVGGERAGAHCEWLGCHVGCLGQRRCFPTPKHPGPCTLYLLLRIPKSTYSLLNFPKSTCSLAVNLLGGCQLTHGLLTFRGVAPHRGDVAIGNRQRRLLPRRHFCRLRVFPQTGTCSPVRVRVVRRPLRYCLP